MSDDLTGREQALQQHPSTFRRASREGGLVLGAVGEVRLAPAGGGAPTVSELGDASSWPVLGTLSGMPIRDASPVEAMDQIIRAFDVTVDMMGSAVPPAARGELRLRETIRQRVEWRGVPASSSTLEFLAALGIKVEQEPALPRGTVVVSYRVPDGLPRKPRKSDGVGGRRYRIARRRYARARRMWIDCGRPMTRRMVVMPNVEVQNLGSYQRGTIRTAVVASGGAHE